MVAITLPREHERDVVGSAEGELVADHPLEPVTAGLGTVEDARVGELELAQCELVAVAARAVLVGERARQQPLIAAEERPHPCGRQPRADRGERLSISARAEAVVERRERQPLLLGLTLGPLMPVQTKPERVRRIRARLHERRPPLTVADIKVVVVHKQALTAETEMRVPIRAAVPPAAPPRNLLLRDTDHNHPEPALSSSSLKGRGHPLLLRLTPLEMDQLNPLLRSETLDPRDIPPPDVAQKRRRRNHKTAVEEKPHHQPLAHQPRHIPLKKDPVDRTHLKRHMVAQ